MIKKGIIGVFLALGLVYHTNAQNIDTEQSKVSFAIGNLGFNTVEGTFTGMKGLVSLNADASQSVINVCIDAATVNTDNKKRDKHLRTEDFFDVEKYPTICFVSTGLTKTPNGFDAVGMLTMHGVTKEVTIPLTVNDNTISGTLMVNRKDYNVGEGTGKFTAGYDVEIDIHTVLK